MRYSKSVSFFFRVMITILFMSLLACSGKGLKKLEEQDATLVGYEQEYQSAIALVKDESFKEAAEKFEALSQKHPSYPGPYVNAGISWYRLGEFDQARSVLNQVLNLPKKQDKRQESEGGRSSLKPFLLVAHNYLGLIAREAGDFDQAQVHYREALAIDSEHAPTIRNLAILLDLYQGKIADAVVLYEKYQSLLDEPDSQVKDWIFDINARLERDGG